MACKHPALKSFTFKDGNTIRLCPDCTRFDTARIAVISKDTRHLVKDAELQKELQAIRIAEESEKAVGSIHGRERCTTVLPDSDSPEDEEPNNRAVAVTDDLFDKYDGTEYSEGIAIQESLREQF